MSPDCARCGHAWVSHLGGVRPGRCLRRDCACGSYTTSPSLDTSPPSVPVGGLPDGTRVRAVVEGVLKTTGGERYVSADGDGSVWLANCVSVEPVPVVPEPGRWYEASTCHWFALPNGWLIEYDDKGFHVAYPPAAIERMYGPLVECEPPAEFRDGQQ